MKNEEKTQLQKKILNSLTKDAQGRLILAQRFGKTKLIIDLIKRDKPSSILWVTPSTKLANEDIPKEFETWGAKKYLDSLTTSTWKSLPKIKGHYGLIVLDEETFITSNNAVNLLNGSLKGRIISMTGSSTKHFDKQCLYDNLGLKILYELSINKAVNIGLLANYTLKVVNVEMSTIRDYQIKTKYKSFITSEKANYNYLTKTLKKAIDDEEGDKKIKLKVFNRLRAIKNSPSKLKVAKYLIKTLKGRKLVFTGSIDQAEKLCTKTYHSKTDDKDLKDFLSGKIDCITMVNAGGTGFTYKNVDHLILVQTDSNNNGNSSQKLTRILLKQKDFKAIIWIVCLLETQDEKWVEATLESFDKNKIEYLKFNYKKYGK